MTALSSDEPVIFSKLSLHDLKALSASQLQLKQIDQAVLA